MKFCVLSGSQEVTASATHGTLWEPGHAAVASARRCLSCQGSPAGLEQGSGCFRCQGQRLPPVPNPLGRGEAQEHLPQVFTQMQTSRRRGTQAVKSGDMRLTNSPSLEQKASAFLGGDSSRPPAWDRDQ